MLLVLVELLDSTLLVDCSDKMTGRRKVKTMAWSTITKLLCAYSYTSKVKRLL